MMGVDSFLRADLDKEKWFGNTKVFRVWKVKTGLQVGQEEGEELESRDTSIWATHQL